MPLVSSFSTLPTPTGRLVATATLLLALSGIAPASRAVDVAAGAIPAAAPSRWLVDGVALAPDAIVVAVAGDLWALPRQGSVGRRLTAGPAEDAFPAVSPDGRRLAFSREAGGNWDVWVADLPPAAARGAEPAEPRRLTWHPKSDWVRGWTPGGEILFASDRPGDHLDRLYTIAPDGVAPVAVDVPRGVAGAVAPDGRRLAYLPWSFPYEVIDWRHYRGGLTSPLWMADLASGAGRELAGAGEGANHRFPMWAGGRLYSASDAAGGAFDLYDHGPDGTGSRRLTTLDGYGVVAAAADDRSIVYVDDGRLFELALAARGESPRELPLSLPLGAGERGPRTVAAARFAERFELTPDGSTFLVAARGEILAWSPGGPAENLTRTPGIAEREPAVSPDGSRFAVFSDAGGTEGPFDASGGYRLEIRALPGGERVQTVAVEDRPSFYREPSWSPDGRRIAFTDLALGLWLADLETGSAHRIDRSDYVAQGGWQTSWSPDGRWLAYAKARPGGIRQVFLYDTRTGTAHAVTDGTTQAEQPVFDRSGRWLWLVSSADARLAAADDVGWGLLSSQRARPLVTRDLYLVVLRAADLAPIVVPPGLPRPGAEGLHEPLPAGAEARVDLDGIDRRIVPVPSGTRDYQEVRAGGAGVVFVRVYDWPATPGGSGSIPTPVLRIDLASPRDPVEVIADADELTVSADGAWIAWSLGGERFLARTADLPTADGAEPAPLDTAALTVEVDPAAEWRQMYRDAWRMMRDVFYDPGHHGQDLPALAAGYAEYLPGITRRSDLNRLFRRMLGHVSVSHLGVGGGDQGPEADAPAVGELGADFVLDDGRYRFARVLRTPHFSYVNPLLRAPLDQPGMEVREGDWLLAVDGEEVRGDRNVFSYLEGKARRPVEITVASEPDGPRRTYTVVPLPGAGTLRRAAWAEENRRRVEELSGGRLAYVYVGGWGGPGLDDFYRGLLGHDGAEGIVLDQRFNTGGTTADAAVEALARPPLYAYAYRHGEPFSVPPVDVRVPVVLLANRWNVSAAETFALMFRLAGVGPIVGTRTTGGGIGAALWQPRLVDGGRIRIPNRAAFDPSGSWTIENRGVEPDVEVEITADDGRAGRDPQLDAAVQKALAAIEAREPRPIVVPAYPVHP